MGDGRGGQPEDAYCELSFSSNVSLLATVRRFIEDFFATLVRSASISSNLVGATHELLTNAARCSADGNSGIRIGVLRARDECRVSIDIYYPTTPAHGAELVALFEQPRGDHARSTSALGRIVAESKLAFRCDVAGDVVHLAAEGVFDDAGGRNIAGMTNIETPELTTRTSVNGSLLTVTMNGAAEGSAMSEVAAFIRHLHEFVTSDSIEEVVLDVRALSFMTASCFEALVGWIDRLQSLSGEARYRIRFVYDERKHWQSRSLGALATLGADVVRLETSF